MYEKYDIEIKFRDKIAGGIPKNPKVIEDWINAKMKGSLTVAEKKNLIAETKEAMDTDEEIKKSWNGFKQDDKGLYIEDRYIKAMIKEAAYVLEITKGKGSVQKRQVIQHGLFIKPAHIHMKKEGKTLTEPDGYEEKPLHVIGPMGPRDALKRYDYIEKAGAIFQIWIVKPYERGNAKITEKLLRAMLELGQEIGLGADRSQQLGKFDLLKFEKIEIR